MSSKEVKSVKGVFNLQLQRYPLGKFYGLYYLKVLLIYKIK
jgi:hypothetical protein